MEYTPPDFEMIRRSHRFEKHQDKSGTIYFVGYGEGPIKIGFTTNFTQRLIHLQTACPFPLVVHATFDGTPAHEYELHERFREHFIRGEWFEPHPDILAEIERLTENPHA